MHRPRRSRYEVAIAVVRPIADALGMKKRVLAGVLWFFATWYAWNVLASFAGVTDLAGPVVGLAAGLLFAVDPLGRIWTASKPRATQADAPGIAAELA
jgi:membrane associated rhomboid family serine protease